MLIECPACARSYHVSRAEIGEEGRTVICPRCDARWFVDCDGAGTLIPPGPIRPAAAGPYGAVIEHEAASGPSIGQRLRTPVAAALCLGLAMGFIGARAEIVRFVPRVAGVYAAIHLPVNLRGLEIAAISPARAAETPADVTISGEIRNVAKARVGVPRLTYQVRDAAGTPLLSWTERAPARTLAMGRTMPFASAPHRLPPDAHSVLVRFEDEDEPAPLRMAKHIAN